VAVFEGAHHSLGYIAMPCLSKVGVVIPVAQDIPADATGAPAAFAWQTLVPPRFSPCGGSPVRSDLEFTLTQLTTTASTLLVLRRGNKSQNPSTSRTGVLSQDGYTSEVDRENARTKDDHIRHKGRMKQGSPLSDGRIREVISLS